MINLFLVILISLFFIYLSILMGNNLKLIDYPNKRKKHLYPAPYTGGIGVFLSFLFIIWILYFDLNLTEIILSSFFILIVGVIDDKYKINVGTRILFQNLIIFFFIHTYQIQIQYIFDFNNNFRIDLESFGLIFTLLCVILVINASNYIDGIDGLLCTSTIFVLCSIIFLQFYFYNKINLDLIYLNIPLIVFFIFNLSILQTPKVFFGNGGSTMLGFIISFVIIYYGYYSKLSLDPELIMWTISFMVFEFLSTNLSRILRKKNIFTPGNDHIHYALLKKYKTPLKVNSIILLINLLFLLFGFYCWIFSQFLSVVAFIILFGIYFLKREKLIYEN